MNPLMVSEGTLVLCMVMAAMVGAFLGYCWKEREHAHEIAAIVRIAKRIEAAKAQKERAPKDPFLTAKLWKEKDEEEKRRPSPWPC